MSAEKALDILDLFTQETTQLTVPQLAEHLGQPVSSVYRHLRVLKDRGFVIETFGGYYKLGYRFLEMANIVRSDITITEIALPVMRQVTKNTEETSILTVVSGLNAVCLETVPSVQPIKVSSEQGKILPLYGGASTKILLAYQPDETIDRLYQENIVRSHTPYTITDKASLKQDLATIREQGYALSDSEIDEGVYAIGVPIKNRNNEVVAGLSIAGPSERIKKREVAFYIQALESAVKEIQQYL